MELYFALAKNIARLRDNFSAEHFFLVFADTSGAFIRSRVMMIICVHIIYIHTHIYLCNYRSYLARTGFTFTSMSSIVFSIAGNESDGERGEKRAGRREFRTFLPDLSVAFPYFVNTKTSV